MSRTRALAPVFIVGSPRSGTTWLYHLLLSSGGFAVYRAEANVFNLLAPRFGDLSVPRHRAALLDAWLPSELFRRSGLDPPTFAARVHAHCRNPGDLLRLLMEGIAEQQQVPRWAECTPENLLYVRAIKRTIPDALFLHIVRDGRDVACSLAKQGWIGGRLPTDHPSRIVQSGLYWDWMIRRGRGQLAAMGEDAREVRFEALVHRPRETLASIGAFLQHELDYDAIRRRGIGTVTRPNTSFPADPTTRDFQPIGRWRQALDAEVLSRVEAAIGDLLIELGYGLESNEARRRRARRSAETARRLAFGYFGSRHWLKTRTPLGQVFTNLTLLNDFNASREQHLPDRKRSA